MSGKVVTQIGKSDVSGTQTYTEGGQEYRTFVAAGSITAGDFVSFAVDVATVEGVCKVVQSPVVSTGDPTCVGIATQTVSSGQHVQVLVKGFYATANCSAASAGLALIPAGTTAGRAEAMAATDTCGQIGISCGAATLNVGPVYLFGGRG